MTVQLDWIPDLSTFSSRLAAIRHQMGWNIKEAAVACAIRPSSWREWELSGRRPRGYQEICEEIAKHTGVDYVWLMTGQDRRPKGEQLTSGGRSNTVLTHEYEPYKRIGRRASSGHVFRSGKHLTCNNPAVASK
ncbi:Uncharacterised protein [Mycobacteroides abscessus subsp. abscessus]|nr:Uncharacterised protein [Mycobacteroides abscessus subsp. abscessus]SIM74658.1 Uncharacterised protein [Mycobacteroides abscessus subsp. abscessus]